MVLQSTVELGAPREGKGGTVSHPGFRNIIKEKKVWIAVSNKAKCRIDKVDVNGREGYVQAVDITVNQQRIRVVNVYDQKMPRSNRKPAEEINWSRLLRGRCIVAGDMNAHSRMWNARAGQSPGNARFWEGIVEDFECRIWNTEEETRWGVNASNHSITDLILSIFKYRAELVHHRGRTPHEDDKTRQPTAKPSEP